MASCAPPPARARLGCSPYPEYGAPPLGVNGVCYLLVAKDLSLLSIGTIPHIDLRKLLVTVQARINARATPLD